MKINGIDFDVNIEFLEEEQKKYREYKKHYESSKGPRGFNPGYTMTLTMPSLPDDTYMEIREILGRHLSQSSVDSIIDERIESSRRTTSRFLTKLLGSADTNAAEIEKNSGLEHRAIDRALSEERSLPATTLKGLCLIFRMDMEDVETAFQATDNRLTDDIPDKVFRLFIKDRNYSLPEYAETVCDMTKAAQKTDDTITLSSFYTRKYKDFTVHPRKKPSQLK